MTKKIHIGIGIISLQHKWEKVLNYKKKERRQVVYRINILESDTCYPFVT